MTAYMGATYRTARRVHALVELLELELISLPEDHPRTPEVAIDISALQFALEHELYVDALTADRRDAEG